MDTLAISKRIIEWMVDERDENMSDHRTIHFGVQDKRKTNSRVAPKTTHRGSDTPKDFIS